MAFTSKEFLIHEGNAIGGLPANWAATGISLEQDRFTAKAALKKGQLVEVSADFEVQAATAKSTAVIGVCKFDVALGGFVVIETEGFVRLTSSAAITVGAQLVCAAEGKVAAFADTGTIVGVAMNATTAADQDVYCKLSV